MPSMSMPLSQRLLSGGNDPLVFLVRLLLSPAYLAYLFAVTVRNALYDNGLLPVTRLDVPVVSVGNLTVGGTGKTPLVIELARRAAARGRKVAVVARSYGATADEDGRTDEVALLAARAPEAIIVMAPDKLLGARRAAQEGVDLILVDDGFQHRRLHRDMDIVVVNARVPVGNGYVLPLGGLRESPSALARADLVVLTHADGLDDDHLAAVRNGLAAWRRDVPIVLGRHVPVAVRAVRGGAERPAASLAGEQVHLFCGIAEPDGFRRTVEGLGATVTGITVFPDHHAFDAGDLAQARAAARTARLLCTEKDAAKVAAIPGTDDIVCLTIDLHLDGALPPIPGLDG